MGRDLIGVILGKYHCVEFIGHGGMAEVYRAVDIELDRVVAIKVLHPFLVSEEGFLDRFRREARTLAALKHPNIVQVHDSGLQDFNSYVVMEYVPGPTLRDRLRELNARNERMPLAEVRRIFDALFAAMRYAHRAGIVHRDLKPNNVILADDGRVVLADFGLAKIMGSTIHTASMATIGTPAYMAPEQAQSGAVDLRSDLYALGVILFELLTGRLPFEADTPFAMIAKHSQESLPRLSKLRRELPHALDRVLLTATAKDPTERFQNVDQFADALNAAFEGRRLPLSARRLRLPRFPRPARVLVFFATATVILLGMGAGGLFNTASPLPTGTPTTDPSPTATPRGLPARINGATNLYAQPDPLSQIVGRVEDGAEVAVLDRLNEWWFVRTLNAGLEGWLTIDHLDFIPTPTPTATFTNTPPPGATATPRPTDTLRPSLTRQPSTTASRTASPTPSTTEETGGGGPVNTPGRPTLPVKTPVNTPIPTPIPSATRAPTATTRPPTLPPPTLPPPTATTRPPTLPPPTTPPPPPPTPTDEPTSTPTRIPPGNITAIPFPTESP